MDLTPEERRILRGLRTPEKIQAFLDTLPYHDADTAFSPRLVLRERTAHCLEGAMLAALALRFQGEKPLILDLEAEQDSDHVIAVYRRRGAWGAIASSNFAGLRSRAPVYRNLRELALSYFENYFNHRRERSLRTFSRPVDLSRFDAQNWMTSERSVWCVAEHLCLIPHTRILTPAMERALTRVDARTYAAAMVGAKRPRS
jgi:hypothetical protein